ncbi:type II toxin-antitoxin system prevent-host-death family antitoxin [Actinomycetospora sp. OC33-EN08]|uniref:Antitoxin n=1 Tax=Actinomycetospora aurantiaca TaxID=3129233 RepID=A0ABU8MUZ0_9PSEU
MTEPVEPDLSGAREVSVTEARGNLAELIDAVRDGEFVYLVRHGERVAALMPADVAENYERMEDDYWARRADDARAAIAAGDEDTISWQQYLADSA